MELSKLCVRERVDSETRTKAENEKGRIRVPLLGGADGNLLRQTRLPTGKRLRSDSNPIRARLIFLCKVQILRLSGIL